MWWLASRVLASVDPAAECWAVVDELDRDPTARLLSAELGESAAVVLIGWPELAGSAVLRRGDLAVMVVDADGAAEGLVRRLRSGALDVVEIPPAGLSQAVVSADVVLVEALALGGGAWPGVVAAAGSWAAAAVARSARVPVVLVAGAGRVLPGRMWEAMVRRLEEDPAEPWERPWEVIQERGSGGASGGPSGGGIPDALASDADLWAAEGSDAELRGPGLWDQVAGPSGMVSLEDAWRRADCPIVAELLGPLGDSGL